MLAGARLQPCHEVLTTVAARLVEPADVGAMCLVSRAWNAAATDGTVTARLPKFATGMLCIPILLDEEVTDPDSFSKPQPLNLIAREWRKGMVCHACASCCLVNL